MLLVQEHLIKLGGVKLSGQVKSIDISETATIENIEDDKGKTKANQPTGYEAAKITVEFILEDTASMTQEEQIASMQRLFRPYGQTKAKLLEIVNEDCAACGISTVYFEKLSIKNVIAQSGRTATLELLAPVTGRIVLKKKLNGDVSDVVTLHRQVRKKKFNSKKNSDLSPTKRSVSLSSKKRSAGRLIRSAVVGWTQRSW